MIRKTAMIVALSLAMLPYQNCSRISSSGTQDSSSQQHLSNNGQPYDGKPYVLGGLCPDGTSVVSRILVESADEALLVRENCETLNPPRSLVAGDFTLQTQSLTYSGDTYYPEQPAVALKPMSKFMYQNDNQAAVASASPVFITGTSSAATVSQIKAGGSVAFCQMSAQTVFDNSADRARLQSSEIGTAVPGSPSERWLDIRSANVRSVILSRLDRLKQLGCDGALFTQVESYHLNQGFPLTAVSQAEYNEFLAHAAHDRKMLAGLLNASTLMSKLAYIYDISVNGRCFQYNECEDLALFAAKNKPVFLMEFTPYDPALCTRAAQKGMNLAFFSYPLYAGGYSPCP